MIEQIQFDYLQVSQLVDDYALEISPSQLHGIITASACTAGIDPLVPDYLSLVMPFEGLNQNQLGHLSDSLNLYFNQTRQVLDSHMFEFELALPDEDSGRDVITAEMAAWCRGFLTAYRYSIKDDDALSDDAAEALADLTEIALAETGEGEAEELDQALAELVEYLRVSVQLIYDDLNSMETSTMDNGTRH